MSTGKAIVSHATRAVDLEELRRQQEAAHLGIGLVAMTERSAAASTGAPAALRSE